MKKNILVSILGIVLCGILGISCVACNNDKKDVDSVIETETVATEVESETSEETTEETETETETVIESEPETNEETVEETDVTEDTVESETDENFQ